MAESSGSQHDTKRSAVRRWIVRGVVFVLLGAVVNVAVAWGCATFLADARNGWEMHSGATRLESGAVWGIRRRERPGYLKMDCHVGSPAQQWDARWQAARSLIEHWSRVPNDPSSFSDWDEQASGWPMLSFWSRLEIVDYRHNFVSTDARVLPHDKLEKGIYVDARWISKQAILPFGPIWHGVIVNTLFYAAVVVLLYGLLHSLRRRRRVRKGLCAKCAYPVGSSDVCTECGHPVR